VRTDAGSSIDERQKLLACAKIAWFYHGPKSEEHLGQVWIVMMKILAKFDPSKSSLSTYLSRAYRFYLIDEYRKAVRGGHSSTIELFEDSATFITRTAEDREIPEVKDECLQLLARGLKISEISRSLHIPDGTVKSRIHREKMRILSSRF
jgi:DNA-directed RNA polymerase specialized sigma24 family protein